MVFVLARRLQYSDADVRRLAVQVSDELACSGQPAAGATVLLLYMRDVDNAVSLLVQARCGAVCHRVCARKGGCVSGRTRVPGNECYSGGV